MNFDLFRCEGACGLELPRTVAYFRKDKKRGTYRRICIKCEALERQQHRADKAVRFGKTKPWTALYSTKLQGQLFHTCSVACLPMYTLLAIMRLQHNSDYITQVPFRLPEPGEVLIYTSWDKWLDSLSKSDQEITPLLIRIIGGKQGKWVRGNVVFVTKPHGELISQLGGLQAARDVCRLLTDANIYAAQARQIDEEEIRLKAELVSQNEAIRKGN